MPKLRQSPTDGYKFTNAASLRNIERILAFLETGPKTCKQVAAHVHMTTRPVYKYLSYLSEPGLNQRCHLWKWGEPPDKQPGMKISSIWRIGPGRNATAKATQSSAAHRDRSIAKLRRENPEEWERREKRRNEMRKLTRLLERMKANPATVPELAWIPR